MTGGMAWDKVGGHAYFAIFPSDHATARMAPLSEDVRSEVGGRRGLIERDRMHITLHPLWPRKGALKDVWLAAQDSGAGVAFPPFDVALDWVENFNGPRRTHAIALTGQEGLAALNAFRETLGVEMAKSGLKVSRRFRGHVTLCYSGQEIEELPAGPIRWTVRDFALVWSVPRRPHRILGRWPLQGTPIPALPGYNRQPR